MSSQPWVKCPKHLCMWPGGNHGIEPGLLSLLSVCFTLYSSSDSFGGRDKWTGARCTLC